MEQLSNLIKCKNIVIPNYMLKCMDSLKIDYMELIFLCYLASFGEKVVFDIERFYQDTNIAIDKLMMLIATLNDKKLLVTDVVKNDKGITEEYLNISNFYNKIVSLNMKTEEVKNTTESDIYSIVEAEFGRVLSPIEFELIKSWLDKGYKEDMIYEALKEAVLNGVSNLRYIDRILIEWSKGNRRKEKEVVKNEENI